MDRQIFPRLLALAEVGWTEKDKKDKKDKKDWINFRIRLTKNYKALDLLDIYYKH